MTENIVLLPEAYPVVSLLCNYLFTQNSVAGEFDLLILKKQQAAFAPVIAAFPFKHIFVLDEEYYGAVTKIETQEFITSCLGNRYSAAYFPFNTFKGNAFLLGAVLAKKAVAVNASLVGIKTVPVLEFSLNDLPVKHTSTVTWADELSVVNSTKTEAAECLATVKNSVEVSGERPSFGLVESFAHDIELFCNYAIGLQYAKGKRVLDVGGGLGYGTFLLSKFADTVVYVDKSSDAVKTIEKLWVPLRSNISALCADVTELVLNSCTYDVIYLMEMLEHIEKPEELLGKVKRLLNENGTMMITTPEEDLFPYRVCPEKRWPCVTGEEPERLLDEAIWPWHIQPLGEELLLPMLERVGLKVVRKSYLTYTRGSELAAELKVAIDSGKSKSILGLLNSSTKWSVKDFSVTDKRDPVFSSFFYNLAVRVA